MSPSVAVVGAGAIGGWIADALDRAGWTVSMVARGATLARLRADGLTVEQGGVSRVSRVRTGSPDELGRHDHVILTVKAQVLPDLAPTLGPLVGPDTLVVSGTNGIPWWFFHGFGGDLADRPLESVDPCGAQDHAFPRGRVLGTVVHAAANMVGPARVRIVAADRLIVGEPGGEVTPRLRTLAGALRDGGINAEISSRIRRDVWAKLWGNMNMNPVSALTRSGTARILADPEVRSLCIRMMEEMQACGRVLGLAVDMTPEERMSVTGRLGDFRTSMLQDLDAGRPLELAPQLGAVVEIAGRLGIDVPFSRAVLGLARLISPNERAPAGLTP